MQLQMQNIKSFMNLYISDSEKKKKTLFFKPSGLNL